MDAGDVFTHGVASGDPLPDRVVIWTCAEPPDRGEVQVAWTVARDPGLTDVVRTGVVAAGPERDHTVKVDVGGLEPGGSYHYGFAAAGQHSPVGRFRTPPVDPSELRFAFAACAKYNAGHFTSYGHIAARDDLDFVLHLGDYIYEASQNPPASQTQSKDIGRSFDPLEECKDLAAYRRRYRQYRRDPNVQALHAAHAMIPTLDDHEVADNAWGGGSTEHDEARDGPYAQRKADAFQALAEWMPHRRWSTSPLTPVYRSMAFGSLARLVLVDERTNRSFPRDGGPEECRTQLGAAQLAWFAGEMAAPGTDWTLVGSPGVMAQTWNPGLDEDLWAPLRKLKLMDLEVDGPDDDQWDWCAQERDEVLRLVAGSQSRAVVMSGDIHCGLVADLEVDGRKVADQLVTFSVTSQNLDDKLGRPPRSAASREVARRLVDHVGHWRWFDPDSHGYVLAHLTRDRLDAEWWAVDDVLDPASGELRVATATIDRATGTIDVTDDLG